MGRYGLVVFLRFFFFSLRYLLNGLGGRNDLIVISRVVTLLPETPLEVREGDPAEALENRGVSGDLGDPDLGDLGFSLLSCVGVSFTISFDKIKIKKNPFFF